MTEKFNARKVGFSLAVVTGIVSIACILLVALVPGSVSVLGYIFHGIDVTKISKTPTLYGTIIGFVEVVVLAYIAGWLFAVIYNKLNKSA